MVDADVESGKAAFGTSFPKSAIAVSDVDLASSNRDGFSKHLAISNETRVNPIVATAIYPIQMQLEAYNARDIDSFMKWWAEDCLYYAFPDTLLASGANAIRERHIERFGEPDLHGTLLHRLTVGNMVIDHETVRRTFPEGIGEIDIVCIYEVENGKIAKAWFKLGEKRLLDR